MDRETKRLLSGSSVVVVASLLALVPAYDIYEDAVLQGDPVFPSAAENLIPFALATALVWIGLRLLRTEHDPTYVLAVTKWSWVTMLGISSVILWVLFFQKGQGRVKPVYIFVDSVIAGGIAGALIGLHDAKRTRQQTQLQRERDRIAALFDNTSDCIAEVELRDQSPVIVDVNEAFESTFGYEAETVRGDCLADAIAPDDRGTVVETVRHVTRGKPVECEVERVNADGERRDFIVRGVPLHDESRAGYVVYTDITEQRRIRRRLEGTKAKTEELHRAVADMRACETETELWERAVQAAQDILEFDYAAVVVEEDGMLAPVATTDGFPEDGYRPLSVDEGLAGKTYREEQSFRVDDLTADSDAAPVDESYRSALSVPIPGVGLFQAVSRSHAAFDRTDENLAALLGQHIESEADRVRRERELQEERESLELLNRILRHDLRNDMAVVAGEAELLSETVGDEGRANVDEIQSRIDRMIDLTETARNVVETIGADDALLGRRNLGRVLRTVVQESATPDAEIDLADAVSADVSVVADDLLPELFANLVGNAIKHNDADRPLVRVTVDESDGDVVVRVADNGPGIPDEQKKELFGTGPGTDNSDGTGVGLYLVETLVDRYGGDIWVEDNDPRGAVFAVRMCRAD